MLTRYRLHRLVDNPHFAVYDKKTKSWGLFRLKDRDICVYLQQTRALFEKTFTIDNATPPYPFNTRDSLQRDYPELFI